MEDIELARIARIANKSIKEKLDLLHSHQDECHCVGEIRVRATVEHVEANRNLEATLNMLIAQISRPHKHIKF